MKRLVLIYLFCLSFSCIKAGNTSTMDSIAAHFPIEKREQSRQLFQIPDSIKEKAIFDRDEFKYKEKNKAKLTENFLQKIARAFARFLEKLFNPPEQYKTGWTIGKWVFIVLAAALIIFLLIKSPLIAVFKGSKKVKAVKFEEDEILMSEESIEQIISKAEQANDYRKALRYQLLKLLKHLSETNQISWQQYKTNQDYIYEVKSTDIKKAYMQIARVYDYVWYGERNIDLNTYQEVKQTVQTTCYNIHG